MDPADPTLIGAFEAKTKLSELLERTSRGESFTITKHDRPIARLIAFPTDRAAQRQNARESLLRARKGYLLGGLDVRELREEGRA